MRLVDDWRKAWKWISIQLSVGLALIAPIWMAMPQDVKGIIPEGWNVWIVSIVALSIAIGRLKDQGK